MKDSLQIGRNQHLEPKEILRQRDGPSPQTADFLVRWGFVSQNSDSSNQSDSSSTAEGKNEKNILIWMTREEVDVCCSNLLGSGFSGLGKSLSNVTSDNKEDKQATDADSEDFEDMRDDVQKLVIRARRQMNTDNSEHKPIKNISYTLKVLSTYASLGSLASVFRQTGALDLILELLWSNDVETRRHAGKMLRALASHDGGSRAYVLLSLIQDKPGQMSSSNADADFENRNTVMEMFAETSSGEEAHALDFMQLPQIPGKSLFKLMKCYLKVTSLLAMDSQIGQLMTDSAENVKKEVPEAKHNIALFGNCKFEVTMAISDLIFELCEVMGWNNTHGAEDTMNENKLLEKSIENEKLMKKAVMEKFQKEFAYFMGAKFNIRNTKDNAEDTDFSQLFGGTKNSLEHEIISISKRMGFPTDIENEASSSKSLTDPGKTDSKTTNKDKDTDTDIQGKIFQDKIVQPKVTLGPKASHCIFSSKQKEGVDTMLLSNLIRNDPSLFKTNIFQVRSSFSSDGEYEDYVQSTIRQGWHVKATESFSEIQVGDEGLFRKFSTDSQFSGHAGTIYWFRLGSGHPIRLKSLVIIGQGMHKSKNNTLTKDAKYLPDYLKIPEKTKLWPILAGQDVNKISRHPYASGLVPMVEMKQKTKGDVSTSQEMLSERQWWEVLFFLQKLEPQTQKEAFKEIKKMIEDPGLEHLDGTEEDDLTISYFKDCKINVYQVMSIIRHVTDIDHGAEIIFKKSNFCSKFLKLKDRRKKKVNDSHGVTVTESDAEGGSANKSSTAEDALVVCGLSNNDSDSKEKDSAKFLLKLDGKPDKIHDYLFFICHQSTSFLDSFIRYSTLKEIFGDHQEHLNMTLDMKAEEVLDRLPDPDRRKQDRVVALIFLHAILKNELQKPLSNQMLNSLLFKLQPIPHEDDVDLCIAWMECIRIILVGAQLHGTAKMRGAEVIVATSGCLVGLLRILKWFPNCIESTMKAIRCLSLATQAKMADCVSDGDGLRSSEAQIIRTVVDSIVSAADVNSEEGEAEKCDLSAFFDGLNSVVSAVEKLLEKQTESTDLVRWQDNESHSETGALFEGLCVCNFLVSDHEELMRRTHNMIMRLIKKIHSLAPARCPSNSLVKILKSKIEKFAPHSTEDFSIGYFSVSGSDLTPEEMTSTKLESVIEELLSENFSMTKLLRSLRSVLYNDDIGQFAPSVSRIVNTVIPSALLPTMNQKMSADELSQCVDLIELVLFDLNPEKEARTSVLATVMDEGHRPATISTLFQLIETLCASTLRPSLDSVSSIKLKEIITKAVALLQRIADVDRDSAVVMCGLDAKQYLTKAIEKHDSVPKASELIEFLSNYDKYRVLHSKLLVVVLGGTIGVALRCMEDARRMQNTLGIPLLDRLFESLCQGSDFDVKEDKCWEKLEVSTNHRQVTKLTDGNFQTYWESNGSSGSHWVNVYMKKGVFIRKMTVQVSQDDSSYMPARFVVMGGTRPSDVSHQLNVTTVSTTDTKIVVLENEKKFWPIIRICVRRCQQGGIDTRIRGLEIVGPKPSFWPVLLRQLCVRTCLAYFVRARAWISSCTKINDDDDAEQPVSKKRKLMNHGILNLSSKVIQAIRHEQEFADLFLPNDESSIVLGQAFRNAVINPLVSAILNNGVVCDSEVTSITNSDTITSAHSEALISQLLSLYLEMSSEARAGDFDPDRLRFLSRLRCLTRLLVDLNPVIPNSARRLQEASGGTKEWQQKIQSKSAKDDDSARTARSKVSSAPSVHPFMHDQAGGSKTDTKEVEEICVDELLNPTPGSRSWSPGLNPLAKEWCLVVTDRIQKFLNKTLTLESTDKDMVAATDIGEEFCRVLANEHESIRMCTTELFGSSVQFLTELVKGISVAVGSLFVERTVAFGRNVALTIHKILMKSKTLKITQDDLKLLKQLKEFLFLSNGLELGCVLESLYCSLLASRLLNYDTFSLDIEKEICDSLSACFPDGRPSLMLQDAKHSKVLWNGFISHRIEMFDAMAMWSISDQIDIKQKLFLQNILQENFMKLDLYRNGALNVQVVSPVSWRLYATRKDAVPTILEKLDRDLLSFIKDYETYFNSAYHRAMSPYGSSNSGPLHWTGEGWAEVRDTVTGQIYKVTTTQMLLLLHFNVDDTNEVDISEWKNSFPHHWDTSIGSLVKLNILEKSSENCVTLAINTAKEKVHKQQVIDASATCNDGVVLCERIYDVERITEKRNTIIDCAIIKCVKERSSCLIDALLFNVARQCLGEPIDKSFFNDKMVVSSNTNSNHFLPMSSEIRARCELLIDLGYMKRDRENPQTLEYVPDPPPIRSRTSTICAERESLTDNLKIDETIKEGDGGPKTTDNEVEVMDIAREVEVESENDHEDGDDEWQTAESSSFEVMSPSKSGAISKTKKQVEKTVYQELFSPLSDLVSWHLAHGMSENPAVIILRKSCKSLTKSEIFDAITKSIETVSETLSCDENIIEALLLQMDWRVDDLIEHYTTDQSAMLQAVGIFDKKEKEKGCNDDLSEQGAACSSAAAHSSTPNEDSCCPICTTELESDQCLALQCKHYCCFDCWRRYLMQKLDENQSANAKCPVANCEARPTLQTYERLFKDEKETFERYKLALVRSFVDCVRSLTWCHCPIGCEMVVRKGSSWKNIGTCFSCGSETCFACTYAEAHYPASCGHMSQWLEDGGYFDGMGDDARSKHLARLIAKRCPNCQANIEKDDGCLHMKCLKCSHDFCWRCLKTWRPTHRDYYKCSAKVSKLAQAGMKFQDHNKRCQFHHKAKLFPLGILKRLQTLDATTVSPLNLTSAIRACVILIKARKALAYCNIFSYYSADTEKMKTMELHSQVLENSTHSLQEFLDKTLLGVADINNSVGNLGDNERYLIQEHFSKISDQLRNLLAFSTQDMKIGLATSRPGIPSDGKNLNKPGGVLVNARPAGMSDEEREDDIFGMSRHDRTLEDIIGRVFGDEDNDADDDDDDDADNFPSSDDDTFSDDDDDDDDDDDNDGSDDDSDDEAISDDTAVGRYGMPDDDELFDLMF